MVDEDSELLEKIRDAFSPPDVTDKYPKEAMKVGTIARSTRLNRLGVITDAFYDGEDKDGKKIISYNLLLFPKPKVFSSEPNDFENQRYYVTTEYEYEIIGYLMMKPVNMSKVNGLFDGRLF